MIPGAPERALPNDPRFRSGEPSTQPSPPELPAPVAALVDDRRRAELVWVKPGTEVWRYGDGVDARFIKWAAAGADADEVRAEADHLAWLGPALAGDDRIAVPGFVGAHLDGDAWLVTTPVDGASLTLPAHRTAPPEQVAELVGRTLRHLHDVLPANRCPFTAGVGTIVESARRRLAAGGLESDALPAPFAGREPAEVVAWLAEHAPDEPADDVVVAHGDPSLPNFLLAGPDRPVGLVDLGRLGVSDRYRDLAIVVRSFVSNHGAEAVWRLTDAYGVATPSAVRLEWYRIADDLA